MESGYQRHTAVSRKPRARIDSSSLAAPTSNSGGRHGTRSEREAASNNMTRSIPRRAIDYESYESFPDQQMRGDGSNDDAQENVPDEGRHYSISSRHTERSLVPSRGRSNEVNENSPDIDERHGQRPTGRHSESPRRRQQRLELPPDRHNQAARRVPDSQNDRHNPSALFPVQGKPQPPPSAYPRRSNTRPNASTYDSDSVSADSEGSGNIIAPLSTRRDSINSLKELARNKFEVTTIIITERTNSDQKRVPLHTRVKALVDSGCDLDLVHEAALERAGIREQDIEDIGKRIRFEGIGGKKSFVRERVQLSWGKARDEGRVSGRRYFYIVEDLPDNLEMVLGREYLSAAIEKHSK